jgi:hypothetical protein
MRSPHRIPATLGSFRWSFAPNRTCRGAPARPTEGFELTATLAPGLLPTIMGSVVLWTAGRRD